MLRIYFGHWSFWTATARNLFGHSTIHIDRIRNSHEHNVSSSRTRNLCVSHFLPACNDDNRCESECVGVYWPNCCSVWTDTRSKYQIIQNTDCVCVARKLSYDDKTCDSVGAQKINEQHEWDTLVVWKLRIFSLKEQKETERNITLYSFKEK